MLGRNLAMSSFPHNYPVLIPGTEGVKPPQLGAMAARRPADVVTARTESA